MVDVKGRCDRWCISSVGSPGGRGTKYIDKRAAGSAEQKRCGQPGAAPDRIWFRRPFHPDCEYGVLTLLQTAYCSAPLWNVKE